MTDHRLNHVTDPDRDLLADELDQWEHFMESNAAALASALRRGGRPFAARALEELRDYFAGITEEPEPDDDRDLPF